mmetsp:Transcript_77912/g.215349  ORF Transcript_77912/g.215349 Transcript_77912/m.215349 type:complete len:202 (-) Transcript_77912:26-631(-)
MSGTRHSTFATTVHAELCSTLVPPCWACQGRLPPRCIGRWHGQCLGEERPLAAWTAAASRAQPSSLTLVLWSFTWKLKTTPGQHQRRFRTRALARRRPSAGHPYCLWRWASPSAPRPSCLVNQCSVGTTRHTIGTSSGSALPWHFNLANDHLRSERQSLRSLEVQLQTTCREQRAMPRRATAACDAACFAMWRVSETWQTK